MTSIKCDICERTIRLTENSKYLLEREGWSVYCSLCAEKLGLSRSAAKFRNIKVYKL